jgi:hypothetical protein
MESSGPNRTTRAERSADDTARTLAHTPLLPTCCQEDWRSLLDALAHVL